MAKNVVVLCMIFTFLVPAPAFAYLDPGTGSMILQLILGGIAGIAVIFKLYWGRLLTFFGIRKKAEDVDETTGS